MTWSYPGDREGLGRRCPGKGGEKHGVGRCRMQRVRGGGRTSSREGLASSQAAGCDLVVGRGSSGSIFCISLPRGGPQCSRGFGLIWLCQGRERQGRDRSPIYKRGGDGGSAAPTLVSPARGGAAVWLIRSSPSDPALSWAPWEAAEVRIGAPLSRRSQPRQSAETTAGNNECCREPRGSRMQ